MKLRVYGITTCGTVKKSRKWLDEHQIDYEWVGFREKAPTKTQIKAWVKAFGAQKMRNTSGGAYRALGPEKKEWSDAQWTEAFSKDFMLIKRPIIEKDGEPVLVGFRAKDDELLALLK